MKVLILVTITLWSFCGDKPATHVIVTSPEAAAIHVYYERMNAIRSVKPDKKKYILYEIDFAVQKLKEIPIPEVMFFSEKPVEIYNNTIYNMEKENP